MCANAYAYTKRPEAEQDTGARLIGIHLEGPFISMEKKGAQNPAYIRNPDVEMFLRLQEAAHGLVRLITIAPDFILCVLATAFSLKLRPVFLGMMHEYSMDRKVV